MLKATRWNPPPPKSGPRKVVVAGWCGEVEDLTASLTMFAPEGTDVTMVCECAPEVSLLVCRALHHALDPVQDLLMTTIPATQMCGIV